MVNLLALSDTWIVSLAVTQMGVNLVLVFGLAWVTIKTRRVERMEEALNHNAAVIIDQKFDVYGVRLNAAIESLTIQIEAVNKRLAAGDLDLKELDRRDQAIEMKFSVKVDSLKDWIRHESASGQDLAQLCQRLHKIEIAVAASGAPVKG